MELKMCVLRVLVVVCGTQSTRETVAIEDYHGA
ncbi:hypothetical protein BFJ63_vAg13600 [Fusarium oxysporum f. sp. narcissi]|uniref:Uncharacterized protein n=1 Tax=Fusarium oxysporum f. sp. narcissi TaxID=451672 RepID=A0A4Q2V8E1_FUSOX|nr:hypothetical protein BFJ63_vAg13600 [Fusarium oxysporum f. sp. narcissi]